MQAARYNKTNWLTFLFWLSDTLKLNFLPHKRDLLQISEVKQERPGDPASQNIFLRLHGEFMSKRMQAIGSHQSNLNPHVSRLSHSYPWHASLYTHWALSNVREPRASQWPCTAPEFVRPNPSCTEKEMLMLASCTFPRCILSYANLHIDCNSAEYQILSVQHWSWNCCKSCHSPESFEALKFTPLAIWLDIDMKPTTSSKSIAIDSVEPPFGRVTISTLNREKGVSGVYDVYNTSKCDNIKLTSA